jgi:thiosulfate reductase cytochrome b subunit
LETNVDVAYGILSGHFRRAFFPVGPAAVMRDAIAALRFRLPHRLGVYNAVQKTLYLGVLAAGVIMVKFSPQQPPGHPRCSR